MQPSCSVCMAAGRGLAHAHLAPPASLIDAPGGHLLCLLCSACTFFLPCRYLVLKSASPAWSPASHRRFMPSFRAATRELLLVANRTGPAEQAGAAKRLGDLPRALLLRIIGLAAYPAQEWSTLDFAAMMLPLAAAGLITPDEIRQTKQALMHALHALRAA